MYVNVRLVLLLKVDSRLVSCCLIAYTSLHNTWCMWCQHKKATTIQGHVFDIVTSLGESWALNMHRTCWCSFVYSSYTRRHVFFRRRMLLGRCCPYFYLKVMKMCVPWVHLHLWRFKLCRHAIVAHDDQILRKKTTDVCCIRCRSRAWPNVSFRKQSQSNVMFAKTQSHIYLFCWETHRGSGRERVLIRSWSE